MRPSVRFGALALVLHACIGVVAAGGLLTRDGGAADESTGSIGPVARRTAAGLALSLEDKSRIFVHVMRVPDAPVADVEVPEPTDALPSSVALQDLPADATKDVPQAAGYKFVKLDDRILLVNPGSRMVVAEMPRYKLFQ